ncbi:PD40 domain-containing protein [Neobacillus dielmonensis]|uniref:PD40 domain-containing protein n=1 Tax=Neobacillus dielmonensis TaxID=1347369 RepID=UPI0005A81880|nr:PD40 domain-containing protein [Neobacillus dielmonensis]
MNRKKWLIVLCVPALLLISLLTAGVLLAKEDTEKDEGLTNQYDVSVNKTIAYVTYQLGTPVLNVYNEENNERQTIVKLENDKRILDPSFSADGKLLAFVVQNKDMENDPFSSVRVIDLETKKTRELFSNKDLVTEVEFGKNDTSLFFLGAGTFTNYSPITGKRPHDFDIFQYSFTTEAIEKLTDMKKYSMTSLVVSGDGSMLYLQSDDDSQAKTAEEIFDTKQRIFSISLEDPGHYVVSEPDKNLDIFDFAFTPDGKHLIYQAIANLESGGTFQYELYSYDFETKEGKQLTNMESYASHPVVAAEGQTVYFMVDSKFGKDNNGEWHLYKLDLEEKNPVEVFLPS